MQLLITPLAAFDLEEIGDYIAQDNPVRAGTFIAELRAHCEKICLNPAGYRRRPELSDELRSCAHGNYVIWLVQAPQPMKYEKLGKITHKKKGPVLDTWLSPIRGYP